METQLTNTEFTRVRQLLQDYEAAQEAITTLEKNNGRLDTSFDELWNNKNGVPTFDRRSLWQVTIKQLREELCGDEGWRVQFQEYTKNPTSAPLLTGLIVSLVSIAGVHGLPLDPAIATVIVLYILKVV